MTVQRNVPQYFTRSICGWNLFQPRQWQISMTNIRSGRDSNPVHLSFEPQPDRMSHRGQKMDVFRKHSVCRTNIEHDLFTIAILIIDDMFIVITSIPNQHDMVIMLAYRRRRWFKIRPAAVKCLVFAGENPSTAKKLCHATATHNLKCLNRSWSSTPRVCEHIRQVCVCKILWRELN